MQLNNYRKHQYKYTFYQFDENAKYYYFKLVIRYALINLVE